jgi:hypothetical protein
MTSILAWLPGSGFQSAPSLHTRPFLAPSLHTRSRLAMSISRKPKSRSVSIHHLPSFHHLFLSSHSAYQVFTMSAGKRNGSKIPSPASTNRKSTKRTVGTMSSTTITAASTITATSYDSLTRFSGTSIVSSAISLDVLTASETPFKSSVIFEVRKHQQLRCWVCSVESNTHVAHVIARADEAVCCLFLLL